MKVQDVMFWAEKGLKDEATVCDEKKQLIISHFWETL